MWLLPLSLMLGGGAAIALYQSSLSGRVHLGSALIDSRTMDLQQLRRYRMDVLKSLARIEANRKDIEDFYESRLATERIRLTAVISEVKDLARRAGLEPGSISYPSEPVEKFDLSTRFMVFSVDGRYAQLRRLINFLELSDMFLVVNEISLSGHGNGESLRISLRLSTTFRGEQQEEHQARRMQVRG